MLDVVGPPVPAYGVNLAAIWTHPCNDRYMVGVVGGRVVVEDHDVTNGWHRRCRCQEGAVPLAVVIEAPRSRIETAEVAYSGVGPDPNGEIGTPGLGDGSAVAFAATGSCSAGLESDAAEAIGCTPVLGWNSDVGICKIRDHRPGGQSGVRVCDRSSLGLWRRQHGERGARTGLEEQQRSEADGR